MSRRIVSMQYLVCILLVAVASSPVPESIRPLTKAKSSGLFSTILKANKQVDDTVHLFEGDIVQTMSLENALKDNNKRWPNGQVPYVISSQFDTYAKSQIQKAIDRYHAETCIRFVKRANEQNYINIVSKDGCYSAVGVSGGAQELSLANGCYQYVGIILHEMMHAVGFFHEQSRTDRDSHITINWNNIEDGMAYNFDSYPSTYIDDLGTNYDYNSIMHYDQYAFSKNGNPTIVPKQSGAVIGNIADFSTIDIQKINKYYECSGRGNGGGDGGGSCSDNDSNCPSWAASGYCSSSSIYYQFMQANCPASCGLCSCTDKDPVCYNWALRGYCVLPGYDFMEDYCPKSCNLC
ncbi:zinc metalloproteinase nas-13-like [Anneissia japonica]|uniref:zinc metalloproteinase nas-13-like n=1 Tax=Anneissia japonica TaxID=1529436 RepID=UPI00142570DE|nr:zinc metalloproteinase nas-13-like [Anneissia japonica]